MNVLLVTLLVCAGHVPRSECNQRTARAIENRFSEGVICGAPFQQTIVSGPLRPDPDEYIKIRCEARRK